jgi:hypothetical protein
VVLRVKKIDQVTVDSGAVTAQSTAFRMCLAVRRGSSGFDP